MTGRIRIMVVDDHPVARFGVRGMLADEPDLELVAEVASGSEALELYGRCLPDVTLMDMQMASMNGAEATRALRLRDPQARVLILSSYSTEHDVRQAVAAGAAGYVMKEADGDELVRAVRAVHAGERYMSPMIERLLEPELEELTRREMELLRLLAEGCKTRDIASAMQLSEGTVAVYLTRLYAKLGARNRTDAVSIGISRGFVAGVR